MNEKLSFSIEDANIIDENPTSNFALLSLDFFASGRNLHEMYVSEETLMSTAETIKNCPLVWKYDPKLDDVYTHDKDEVPCGFVPESSKIESRILDDGRTMLSVKAYVWKRYTGELLSLFKRDGGKKPVSVEMTVKKKRALSNGLLELLDFVYEGITILGSFVTPAIPMAVANVLSFAKIKEEYDEDFEKDFHYVNGSTKIPTVVKENAKKGLELRKDTNAGTSVDIAMAKSLIKKSDISEEEAYNIVAFFSKIKSHKSRDLPSDGQVLSLLWGGATALEWAQSIVDEIEKKKEENYSLSDTSKGEIDPALKEKTSQEMEITMSKEELEKLALEEEAKAKEAELQMATEEGKEKEAEMAAEDKKPAFPPKEEDELKDKKEEKKFEFPKNFNLEQMGAMFADDSDKEEEEEEDEDIKMAKEEVAKGEFASPSVVMSGMFAKMCKMSKLVAKMAEANKVYMQENEELKKFKADLEVQKKNFEVDTTLRDLSEKVMLPDEARKEMLDQAENYSYENIDEWKTYCKAKSFDFAIKKSKSDDVVRVGMPFTASNKKSEDDLWA